MRDAAYLKKVYNKQFNEPLNRWSSEDIMDCRRIVRRNIKWTKDEIKEYASQINANYTGLHIYFRYGLISKIYLSIKNIMSKKRLNNISI